MRIRVEELETEEEFARCYPCKTVPCRSGKVNWTICSRKDCYICKFLQKALVDFEIEDHKGDTIEAIGRWTKIRSWTDASTMKRI
eukprot:10808253-Heterocapsa_arctica.AAC.1